MAAYLLIASQSPFESAESAKLHRIAAGLVRKGHGVTLFLVQNAVLGARAGTSPGVFDELRTTQVEILADEFSLRERGIDRERLAPGVVPADLDAVIDRLAEGHIALWH